MSPEESLYKIAQIDLEKTKEWVELWKVIIPSIVTLFAVYLAYRFAIRQSRTKRNTDLIEKQLQEFYSPIWGCIKRICAQGELRCEISAACNTAWKKVCDRSPKPFFNHDEEFKPYQRQIEYDNEKHRGEVMHLYDKALEIFTSKYWLSESSTREYYDEFYKFVEVWHRYLDRSIPMDVLEELDRSEEHLKPFYTDIEQKMNELTSRLKCL